MQNFFVKTETRTLSGGITKTYTRLRQGRIIATVLIAFFLVTTVFLSIKVVPTGYTGVKTTFGQISEENVPQGINLKVPYVQEIALVNNKQQDKTIQPQIWGETTNKTPVYAAEVVITYQINSQKSSWLYRNVNDLDENLINESIVASSVKSAMVELDVNNVTNRSKIEPLTKDKLTASLNEKYGEDTIHILKVVINDMDFEPAYNDAIAAKSIAQQTYEKQQIENETAIKKAEADKKVSITNAEAKAEAQRISAEAEADANKLIEKSLTNQILQSKFYEKWNGELPKVVGEGNYMLPSSYMENAN